MKIDGNFDLMSILFVNDRLCISESFYVAISVIGKSWVLGRRIFILDKVVSKS